MCPSTGWLVFTYKGRWNHNVHFYDGIWFTAGAGDAKLGKVSSINHGLWRFNVHDEYVSHPWRIKFNHVRCPPSGTSLKLLPVNCQNLLPIKLGTETVCSVYSLFFPNFITIFDIYQWVESSEAYKIVCSCSHWCAKSLDIASRWHPWYSPCWNISDDLQRGNKWCGHCKLLRMASNFPYVLWRCPWSLSFNFSVQERSPEMYMVWSQPAGANTYP